MRVDFKVLHDAILKDYILESGVSRRFARKVKLYGKMYINGIEAKNFYEVKNGDIITLEYDEKENDQITLSDKNINIIYEDEHILIINKEHDVASQPSHKHYEDNIVSYVKKYFQDKNINSNIHIVNRLDYQTSGLMIVAKDGYTHHMLTKDGHIKRKYLALVLGYMKDNIGKIDLPIARVSEGNIKRMVREDGKRAVTLYEVITRENGNTLLDITLLTGRTHQIRVHLSTIGYPLVGDKLYGEESDRLYLHSYYLSFVNPFKNEEITIIDPELNNKYYDRFIKK